MEIALLKESSEYLKVTFAFNMAKEQRKLGKDVSVETSESCKKAAWPELEVDLLEWVTEKRNNGLAILPSLVRLKALDMAKNQKCGFPGPGCSKAG